MSLRVERGLHPQDVPLQRRRYRAFVTATSRPDALTANPLLGTTLRPATQASRRIPEQSVSSKPCAPTMEHKEIHKQGRTANRRSIPMRRCHPQVKAVTTTPGGKPSHFLQISSLLNPHSGTKRRRSRLDVDGPNTAELSFKKRRIRFQLVTSRLSQPYSLPATHIPCLQDIDRTAARRSMAPGLENVPDPGPQKKNPNLHATSILRFSMMNRMRKRLGLKEPGIIRVERPVSGSVPLDAAPRATVHRQGVRQRPEQKQLAPRTSYTTAAGQGRRVVSKNLEHHHVATGKPLHQPSKTPHPSSTLTALAVSSSKLATIDKMSSPSFHTTTSPEFQPPTRTCNLFEDSFAWMHPDGEPFGDLCEETEDVYCDFGVLFGKAQPPSGTEDRHDSETVLGQDGMPWRIV